jgi:hypothetical protein
VFQFRALLETHILRHRHHRPSLLEDSRPGRMHVRSFGEMVGA